jgi:hypothetical protein
MRMAATTAVVAGTATAVSGRVSRRQQEKAQAAAPPPEAQPVAMEEPAAPLAPPSGGLSEEAISQLQQLGALKEQGVLTEEEFAAQKAKILG